ncbi:hypothetical protein [uncultured Microscilla sp.]|uniref:hypothetical protein n=1 Tax=uncultured Microscilla sp. TaxID=432653 RepID=UPI002615F1B5|nr:hypothetical protein [uncultured Microscilla sp.]
MNASTKNNMVQVKTWLPSEVKAMLNSEALVTGDRFESALVRRILMDWYRAKKEEQTTTLKVAA